MTSGGMLTNRYRRIKEYFCLGEFFDAWDVRRRAGPSFHPGCREGLRQQEKAPLRLPPDRGGREEKSR